MYEIAVIAILILMLISAADYVRRAWIQETHPVPATWILMMVVMSISFWMYWENPQKSWTGNIGVVAGTLNVCIILTGVVASNIHHNTLNVAFNAVQRWCLFGGSMVVAVWFFTDNPLICYILMQTIALLAYIATIIRVWGVKKSTEPLFLWGSVFLANLCALYPAVVKNDLFSWIYLGRAIPSTAFMIYIILRSKREQKA